MLRWRIVGDVARPWSHHGAMPNIQIKNVPAETHAALTRQAAAAGQSLQEYLLAKLVEDADKMTLRDILTRAAQREGSFGPGEAAAYIRELRDRG